MSWRRGAFTGGLVAAVLLVAAGAVPLPLYLIEPGTAIDLNEAVSIGHRGKAHDTFYLTDVSLVQGSPLRMFAALSPDVTVKRIDGVMPKGMSHKTFEASMTTAMSQSESIAAVVAERAAGYPIPAPRAIVSVMSIEPNSRANGRLADGDVITAVGGLAIRSDKDIRGRLDRIKPGETVAVDVVRAGAHRTFAIRTIALDGHPRLGVMLGTTYAEPHLPVPVRYGIANVGGSSGGLMMALRIYDELRARQRPRFRRIAGTGTIALDGRVGPIEGTRQKLIAAKRAGATIFLVPKENAADIAGEHTVRVIPVATFAEAVRALDG